MVQVFAVQCFVLAAVEVSSSSTTCWNSNSEARLVSFTGQSVAGLPVQIPLSCVAWGQGCMLASFVLQISVTSRGGMAVLCCVPFLLLVCHGSLGSGTKGFGRDAKASTR